MGGASSTNVVRDSVQLMFNETIKSSTTCRHKVEANEVLNVDKCDIKGVNINEENIIRNRTSCLSETSTNSQIKNDLSVQVQEIAKSVADTLSIPFESATSDNTADIYSKASTTILEEFINSCQTEAIANQAFNCSNSSVQDSIFVERQYEDATNSCLFKNSAVIDATTEVQNRVSALASSETKGLGSLISSVLSAIIWGLVLIIAVVAIIFLGGVKMLFNPAIIILIIAFVSLYFVLGKFFLWPPYRRGAEGAPVDPEDKGYNDHLFLGSVIVFTLLIIVGIIWITIENKKGTFQKNRKEVQIKNKAQSDSIDKLLSKKGEKKVSPLNKLKTLPLSSKSPSKSTLKPPSKTV